MKVVATIQYDKNPASALKLDNYPKPKPKANEVLADIRIPLRTLIFQMPQ